MTRSTGVALVLAAAALAGCSLTGTAVTTFPPASFGAGTTTAAASETRRIVELAISGAGLRASLPSVVYRPAESASLAAAPRLVLQVQLADDPGHGYIVIYELGDATTADAAAREQAAYVASGIGFVQFPPGSEFVIRTVGATVVFFSWSPSNSPDPLTSKIPVALQTVGTDIPVPR